MISLPMLNLSIYREETYRGYTLYLDKFSTSETGIDITSLVKCQIGSGWLIEYVTVYGWDKIGAGDPHIAMGTVMDTVERASQKIKEILAKETIQNHRLGEWKRS